MNVSSFLQKIKPYSTQIRSSVILSVMLGIGASFLRKGKFVIFITSIFPIIITTLQILYLERLFAPLLSLSLILLSAIYYLSFRFFKKPLQALINFKKSSDSSHYVFVILLSLISFLTIIGMLYSSLVRIKINKKDAPQGRRGNNGPRGDRGNTAENMLNDEEIVLQNLYINTESIVKLARRQKYPNEQVKENKTYLENIFIKEAIENLVYSWGFKLEKLELREKHLELNSTCEENTLLESRIQENLLLKMQKEVSDWITVFAEYENGLHFLSQPTFQPKVWNRLYTKKDKEQGLPKSPFEKLNKYDSWLWSQLTKKEYLELKQRLLVKCDENNEECVASRNHTKTNPMSVSWTPELSQADYDKSQRTLELKCTNNENCNAQYGNKLKP